MGGEGTLNTRRGMGSSATGRIQHSQDIYWQARQKTPGLVRPLNDQELHTLISRRDQAHQRGLQTRSTRSTTAAYKDVSILLTKKRSRAMKSVWCERKTVELQRAADRNNTKGFYNGLKKVWGPKKKGPVHTKSTYLMDTFSDSKRVMAR